MKITFISLFEEMIKPYFEYSVLGRAKNEGLFEIEVLNPRFWAFNKHKRTDLKKIGGGAGMLMTIEPFFELFQDLKPKKKSYFSFSCWKTF